MFTFSEDKINTKQVRIYLLSGALTLEPSFIAIVANIGLNGLTQENTTYFTYTIHSDCDGM